METGAAKPIAEPLKQENSMPTPPPTTNGHIGAQDASAMAVSPSSQNVSHSVEETAEPETTAETTAPKQPDTQVQQQQSQTGLVSETNTDVTKKEDPETQRTTASEAFDEITPTAATPSTLPPAESPTATKKQVGSSFNV